MPSPNGALADEVKLLALTIPERSVILNALDDPLDGLAELRARVTVQPT